MSGFRPANLKEHAERIALAYGLEAADLVPSVSFLNARRQDQCVYVTPSLMKAARYATRSSEMERMMLERAYDLTFGEPESPVDPTRRLWVNGELPGRHRRGRP